MQLPRCRIVHSKIVLIKDLPFELPEWKLKDTHHTSLTSLRKRWRSGTESFILQRQKFLVWTCAALALESSAFQMEPLEPLHTQDSTQKMCHTTRKIWIIYQYLHRQDSQPFLRRLLFRWRTVTVSYWKESNWAQSESTEVHLKPNTHKRILDKRRP